MSGTAGLFSLRLWLHLLVLRPLLNLFFGINVEGEEHLEDLDRFVLAANHNSHLDILLLFSVLPPRQILKTRPVAAGDYFLPRKVLGGIAEFLFRPIWVFRGKKGDRPLERMKDHLRAGGNVIIFPEGTRGEPGRMERFRTGVGRLVEAFPEIPAIPVFLSGTEKAFPKDAAFPIPVWNHVTIGPSLLFRDSGPDTTEALEDRIRELSRSRTANRHRRIKRPREAFTVAVLGIDGSGKSTVSRRIIDGLRDGPRACLVSDRLDFFEEGERRGVQTLPTERVRRALGRYAKTARSLKHYKIPKLAELLLRDHLMSEVQRWYAPEVLVLDGSPLINLTAWARLYKGDLMTREVCTAAMKILTGTGNGAVPRELPELAALKRIGLTRMKLADLVLWLDVDPAVSMERIRSRKDEVQVHETEEKLGQLREGYRLVCDVVNTEFGIPVRILDGNAGLDEVAAAALAAVDDVRPDEEEEDADR